MFFEHMSKDYHTVETHEKAHFLKMQVWLDTTNLDIDLAPTSLNFSPQKRNIYHKTHLKFFKPKDHEMTLYRLLIIEYHAYFRSTVSKAAKRASLGYLSTFNLGCQPIPQFTQPLGPPPRL